MNVKRLVLSIGLSFLPAIIGSMFTYNAIPTWYADLRKPFFNPPNWVFGPVWTLLYFLMAVSFYLMWNSPEDKDGLKKIAIPIFYVQLFLNGLWSVLFFGLKIPLLALIEMFLLWIAIAFTITIFYRINRLAAWILVPYICWVTFALILNFAIFMLNR